ncbi:MULTISPECIES: thiol reductant ABC exporter subunit CydC [unclassified Streptococcus]|uniref:thiol reductant ABC exporter subunit CydC n=1 Tax=unclassified Streptococcus TaxID=2608887 RepID=UPI00107278E0|nr:MULTISPECIES: thiol reductant ABC exporter subunit CydC [unclassified Streptococcus]MBF0786346.1 thiol reductant ABC exporter subunit CydC [Streptococcus sp. 19428wC2_LYSM12]MCQ9212455.1 thiol reductant ABC exporter subunit CydC [Streptococcus sp. B01]MCQ9213793.1 thiol reductant ABC exporter subunit CydC [Streptococcus sp. O1]TFV06756.1 thiol reductant ABC exporter subunit CydC [Streptococcus sp. LYSM12]
MTNIPLFRIIKEDRWVKPFFKQYKLALGIAVLLGFLTFFSAGALMFISGFLISKSASRPTNILLVYIPIVLTRTFGIARPVFRYLERLTSHNWVLKMTSKLRLKLYQTLEQDAIFIKRDFRLGDVIGLLAEDINHLQNLYLRTVFPTVIAWILYIFIVIALGFFSWWFASFMLLYLALLILVFPLLSVLVNGARQQKEKTLKNGLYTELTDNVLGVSDWIFSQRGQEYVALHERSQDQLIAVQAKMKAFQNKRTLIFELAYGLLILATFFWASGQFTGNHGGEANWVAAFVLSWLPLIDAFTGLSTASQEADSYADSLERLNALPHLRANAITDKHPQAPYDFKIEKLSFSYPNDRKLVLDLLDLTIPQGEKLAILGRSGSGKSTLTSLLRGDLQPSAGRLLFGGVPTTALGEISSSYISVIQQAPYLFRTSLLNNIRIGNEEASPDQVWQVLERVGLKEMVEALPQGLDTMVDEAGFRFSGGERHRIALARILLKETPVVILDEPTVGLDPITEKQVLATFMEELGEKTVIWITHHLKGIEYADRVIFLENGKLEMAGSLAFLTETSPRFRHLKAVDDGEI